MNDFVDFLLKRVYGSASIDENLINLAFAQTVKDVQYHFPIVTPEEVKTRIISNSNELAVFLFRLGNILHENGLETLKPQVHWLLKELCSCEIYFNNTIEEGFYIIHGQGTVIGSRNTIGKGFKVHQGCTIGHKKNGEGKGNAIGDNVTMYCNSSIIGELIIGDNVVIGAHVLVIKDVMANQILTNVSEIKERELR